MRIERLGLLDYSVLQPPTERGVIQRHVVDDNGGALVVEGRTCTDINEAPFGGHDRENGDLHRAARAVAGARHVMDAITQLHCAAYAKSMRGLQHAACDVIGVGLAKDQALKLQHRACIGCLTHRGHGKTGGHANLFRELQPLALIGERQR